MKFQLWGNKDGKYYSVAESDDSALLVNFMKEHKDEFEDMEIKEAE